MALKVWVIVVVVMVAVAATTWAAEPAQFKCQSFGHWFHCVSSGTDDLEIYPEWLFHTKPQFKSYGLDFRADAPKKWTLLEMRIYPNDQSGAPYDGVIVQTARAWVCRHKGRAVFSAYVEEGHLPPCNDQK